MELEVFEGRDDVIGLWLVVTVSVRFCSVVDDENGGGVAGEFNEMEDVEACGIVVLSFAARMLNNPAIKEKDNLFNL